MPRPHLLPCAASLILSVLPPIGSARAEGAAASDVAVTVVVLRPVNIGASDAVRKTIEKAVVDEGGRVVDASALGCSGADCYRRRAQELGSTHLVIADAAYSDDFRFDLALDLLNVRTGYAVKRRDFCEPCTWPRAHEVTRALAREMALQALADVAPSPLAPEAAGADTPVLAAAAPPPATVQRDARSWPVRWAPLGLVVAGVAVGAYGAGLWALDGKDTSCSSAGGSRVCPAVYDTRGLAVPLTVAGGLAVAGGLTWLLLRSSGDRPPAVSAGIGPGSLLVTGTF